MSAVAFLNWARQYLSEANKLERCCVSNSINNPLNLLYFHAIELTLKAFLRSFVPEVEKHHKLTELYEECRRFGLTIKITNVVALLDAADEGKGGSGLRYGNEKLAALPRLSWTREAVEQLVQAVEAHVEARFPDEAVRAARADKLVFIYGKPE